MIRGFCRKLVCCCGMGVYLVVRSYLDTHSTIDVDTAVGLARTGAFSLCLCDVTLKSGDVMSQITARIPDDLLAELDAAATSLRRTRADVIRQAVEYYLDDYEDIRTAVSVLRDPADPVLDWEVVRRELLDQD